MQKIVFAIIYGLYGAVAGSFFLFGFLGMVIEGGNMLRVISGFLIFLGSVYAFYGILRNKILGYVTALIISSHALLTLYTFFPDLASGETFLFLFRYNDLGNYITVVYAYFNLLLVAFFPSIVYALYRFYRREINKFNSSGTAKNL